MPRPRGRRGAGVQVEVTLSAAGWVQWAKAFYDHAHNAVNAPPEPEPEE